MRYLVVVVVALAAVSAASASPRPWLWTPAQAAAKATVGLDATGSRYSPVVCKGVGKAVGGRFTSFACTYTYRKSFGGTDTIEKHQAWLRTRPNGQGGGCLSLTKTVPASCLRASAAVGGQVLSDATNAFLEKNPNSPVPHDCFGMDGWYGCVVEGTTKLAATVVYTKNGVIVRLL